jgi:hypothetical protein
MCTTPPRPPGSTRTQMVRHPYEHRGSGHRHGRGALPPAGDLRPWRGDLDDGTSSSLILGKLRRANREGFDRPDETN